MMLCFLGFPKRKKYSKAVKQNRELLEALPGKRSRKTDGDLSDTYSVDDEDGAEVFLAKQLFMQPKIRFDLVRPLGIKFVCNHLAHRTDQNSYRLNLVWLGSVFMNTVWFSIL